jgi:hypothetical protein
MARFRIPENMEDFTDYDHITTDPKDVEECFRFNPK